ncbi:mechanosensitive ion channel family protein [Salinirubellus sp. GCM10025818]|jgi:small-conductance mechanosensitive channel|uniref:mechanosensitive ion channel family protein n=1 Tax=Salinirubellus TaxID=2162630 RepID=UPI0030CFEB2F
MLDSMRLPVLQAGGSDPIPDSLSELVAQYTGLLGQVVAFVVAFVLVYVVGRFLLVRLVDGALRARGMDRTIRGVARKTTRAVVFVGAIAIGLAAAGLPSFLTAAATLGGALALAIGFAAQDLIGNFVAGLFILKDKPFEQGDWIEWGDGEGIVEEIRLRVTRVKTFDNELITVPNSTLANNAVTNPVAYDTLRQKFVFGIGYEDDIDEATGIVVEEAEAHEAILDDPEPSVRVTELGDSAVGLQSRFWIADPSRSDFVKARSEYVQAVKERFDAAGIDMPYPHRQLLGEVDVAGREEVSRTRSDGEGAAGDD